MNGCFIWLGNLAFALFAFGIVLAVVAVAKMSAYDCDND